MNSRFIQAKDFVVHRLASPPFFRVFDKKTYDKQDPEEKVFRMQGIVSSINLPPVIKK